MSYLCCADDAGQRSGIYLHMLREKRPSEHATDPANGARLWEASEVLLEDTGAAERAGVLAGTGCAGALAGIRREAPALSVPPRESHRTQCPTDPDPQSRRRSTIWWNSARASRWPSEVDMSGRKVIITGATPGSIGYQVARTLAAWGADVAVTCPRNGEAARETLLRELRDAGAPFQLHRGPSARSRRRAKRHGLRRLVPGRCPGGRLDVLINNAGILRDVLWRWRERRVSRRRVRDPLANELPRDLPPDAPALADAARVRPAKRRRACDQRLLAPARQGQERPSLRSPGPVGLLDRLWPVQAGADPPRFRVAAPLRRGRQPPIGPPCTLVPRTRT